MGTNYYLKSKPCKECGHSTTKKHIAKSSFGWQFHFRGYREENLVSYSQWLEEMSDENKIIEDEYGEQISIEDFKELVEEKKVYLNHYNIICNRPMSKLEEEYLKKHGPPYLYDMQQNCWKDNEGYAFTDLEFC